jgi:hypothetical protein
MILSKGQRAQRRKDGHGKLLDLLQRNKNIQALYISVTRIFANALNEDFQTLSKIDRIKTTKFYGTSQDLLVSMATAISSWLFCDRSFQCGEKYPPLQYRKQVPESMIVPPLASGVPVPAIGKLYRHACHHHAGLSSLQTEKKSVDFATGDGHQGKIHRLRLCKPCISRKFRSHELEFIEYLKVIREGGNLKSVDYEEAILAPHEITLRAMCISQNSKAGRTQYTESELAEGEFVERQWRVLLDRLGEFGDLGSSIAVCDVSTSMRVKSNMYDFRNQLYSYYTPSPMTIAIALSLLVASLSSPPFANHIIRASSKPTLVQIDLSQPLVDSMDIVNSDLIPEPKHILAASEFNPNPDKKLTDIRSVFIDLILPAAQKDKLARRDMVKRVFVFSNMQFTKYLASDTWKSDYEVIKDAFTAAGYDVPMIVYWNLSQDSEAPCPVLANEPGVILMSGWGPGPLKAFMELSSREKEMGSSGGGDSLSCWESEKPEHCEDTAASRSEHVITPMSFLKKVVNKPCFSGLKVYD